MADNITSKNTLKSWFKRGLKPLESQFHAWMDSYWHKNETIPTEKIENLEMTLNEKAETLELDNLRELFLKHKADNQEHKTTPEQGKLDNLADNPNLTYATKQELSELEAESAIIVPVDFTKPTWDETKAAIVDFVRPFFENKTIYTRPVYLLYIWKDSYQSEDAPVYNSLIYRSASDYIKLGRQTIYEFNSPVFVTTCEIPDKSFQFCLRIRNRYGSPIIEIDKNDYKEESPIEVICLYENGDGTLDLGDRTDNTHGWNILYQELKKNKRPMLFLKTPDSGMFCPASYEFTVVDSAAQSIAYTGNVQISYIKETDGISELWVETRNFVNMTGSTGDYVNGGWPILKKYPLRDAVRVSRIQVVETLPTEGLADGDIVILKQA